ncbi:hypothetical protein [Noviherbaspirillum malthae]|uniref:hypothetical protein n=1 Tax=Noviherbaspirillum malthae TaxID=1260987 RepID=UPI00188F78B3|nr:hypothetical protein [Noviherbaspirillum malthae]
MYGRNKKPDAMAPGSPSSLQASQAYLLPALPIDPDWVPPVVLALVPAALLPPELPGVSLLLVPAALLPPELPEPLVLVPDVDFFALVLSPDFALEEPEVPEVPEVPDESVAPVMLLPLPPLEDPVVPVEPEPVPVDELCAIAMPLPNADTSSAIKSFFIYCLHR